MTLMHSVASLAEHCSVIAICLYILYALHTRTSQRKNLPPGPKRVPLFGNTLQLPQIDQHIKMKEWSHQYGDVVYAEFFGKPALILSSAKAAIELAEKRSAKYSDRPPFPYFNDLVGWTGNVAFSPYNERWKRMRRWYQRAFISRSAVSSYHPIQRREVRKLLSHFSQDPGVSDFALKLKRYTVAIIFEVGYGHTVSSSEDDDFMRPVEDGIRMSLVGGSTGASLYDFLPALRYVPAWMPGMQFKRTAKIARKAIQDLEDIPYVLVKRLVETGSAKPSFMASMMKECTSAGMSSEEDTRDIKGAAGTLYAAATDTSLTSLLTFVLAMTQHPEIFAKAQEEMFRVVGDARLPDFDDQASLPYLACIIREVYRWCPSVATLPHQTTEDDVYRGFYIPKGTSVMPNYWAMFRDPDVYPEPDAFIPERFLELHEAPDRELRDPKKIVFGFGRRICPGRYFADDNIWLAAASIVATMNIRKARDESGQEITPALRVISGTILRPEPFLCNIRPRSEKAIQLINSDLPEEM